MIFPTPNLLALEYRPTIYEREADINSVHEDATRKLIDLTLLLEQHEIVLPGFGPFKNAFGEKGNELEEKKAAVLGVVRPFLPVDFELNGQKKTADKPYPNEKEIDRIREHGAEYHETGHDILAFLYDLQIELQNELLGELFDRRLPPRAPKDPSFPVIGPDSVPPKKRPPGSLS